MEQSKSYVCKECSAPVPVGHKFCGSCGAAVPETIQNGSTEYFGAMQTPGKARLVLIRGAGGVEGLTYLLHGAEHVAGTQDCQILFPDDAWVSPRHANFVYRGEKLVVRDEGSSNGVYVRVTGTVPLKDGQQFICGEQVFRIDALGDDNSGPEADQTYFYSSPKRPASFKIVQILEGGIAGLEHCSREDQAIIGREESDLNFPTDIYMSGEHAKVAAEGGNLTLTDLESRNGTYVRIDGERELGHGEYIFLGKQLLRVEMTA